MKLRIKGLERLAVRALAAFTEGSLYRVLAVVCNSSGGEFDLGPLQTHSAQTGMQAKFPCL